MAANELNAFQSHSRDFSSQFKWSATLRPFFCSPFKPHRVLCNERTFEPGLIAGLRPLVMKNNTLFMPHCFLLLWLSSLLSLLPAISSLLFAYDDTVSHSFPWPFHFRRRPFRSVYLFSSLENRKSKSSSSSRDLIFVMLFNDAMKKGMRRDAAPSCCRISILPRAGIYVRQLVPFYCSILAFFRYVFLSPRTNRFN